MNSGNNNSKSDRKAFVNAHQRKFYMIRRAFKVGNIVGTVVLVFFIGKSLVGI